MADLLKLEAARDAAFAAKKAAFFQWQEGTLSLSAYKAADAAYKAADSALSAGLRNCGGL